jgi:hypothetical protein
MRSGISPDFRRHNEEARASPRAFFVGAVHVDEPQMNMNMNGGTVWHSKNRPFSRMRDFSAAL